MIDNWRQSTTKALHQFFGFSYVKPFLHSYLSRVFLLKLSMGMLQLSECSLALLHMDLTYFYIGGRLLFYSCLGQEIKE